MPHSHRSHRKRKRPAKSTSRPNPVKAQKRSSSSSSHYDEPSYAEDSASGVQNTSTANPHATSSSKSTATPATDFSGTGKGFTQVQATAIPQSDSGHLPDGLGFNNPFAGYRSHSGPHTGPSPRASARKHYAASYQRSARDECASSPGATEEFKFARHWWSSPGRDKYDVFREGQWVGSISENMSVPPANPDVVIVKEGEWHKGPTGQWHMTMIEELD